jgi:general secretion pathway protein G
MNSTIQRLRARRDSDKGFTLIELLIVIVVLGILAAVVIFALGGVTAKSAVAACQSDGATLQTAIADANQLNGPNVVTSKQNETTFVGTNKGIQAWPTGTGFTFSLPKGVLSIAINGSATAVPYVGPSSCVGVK